MLIYRFPGKPIVRKEGYFERRSDFKENSFIVCSFDKKNRFQFVENQVTNKMVNSKEIVSVSKADYIIQGTQLVNAIRTLGIKKTVLSRVLIHDFDSEKGLELFHSLEKMYTSAFVYYFEDAKLGTWIGASPEILFQKKGNLGFTVALAATKKVVENEPWNTKEKLEQAFVTDFIEERLIGLKIEDIEKNGPYEHQAGPVKHLKTDFSFSIGSNSTFDFLEALHPSPAISGLPQQLSIELIESLEKHQRELYAGYIGLVGEKQATVYVNLRCAQIQKGRIHLYLGGGYTKDSDPEMEWKETENKSKTILDLVQKL
jgi:isochorismate synthase